MRITILISLLLAPLAALSAPTAPSNNAPASILDARQSRPPKPKPCVRTTPAPSEAETQARHDRFTHAFIVTKNITAAFEHIAQDYINHNPAAQNGFDSAWNILSPIWANQKITPLRAAFKSPQGWLNYRSGSFGEVVDRFRWEGGCIAEHWDQGEKFPNGVNSTVPMRQASSR